MADDAPAVPAQQPAPTYDLAGARADAAKAGLTPAEGDAQIAAYLAPKTGYDLAGARADAAKAGLTPAEGDAQIAAYLAAKPIAPPPPESSGIGSFLRAAGSQVLPTATGMAAALPAAEIGGAIGSALGPIGALGGGLIGGIGGFMLGAKGGEVAQDAILDKFPDVQKALGQDAEQRQADAAQHPYATMAGGLAPGLLFLRPGSVEAAAEDAPAFAKFMANPITARVFGAGVNTSLEALQEQQQGQGYDPTKLAIAAGAGALMSKETALGEKVSHAVPSAIGLFRPRPGVPDILDAGNVDDAINAANRMASTSAPIDVDAHTANLEATGDAGDAQQAKLLRMMNNTGLGSIEQAPDGSYTLNRGEGRSPVPLKVWNPDATDEAGEPAPRSIDPTAAQAIRDHYAAAGVDTVFYQDHPGLAFDGVMDPAQPDTIFLSNDPKRAVAQVAGHEFSHVLGATKLPDGTSLGDLLNQQIARGITPAGQAYAEEMFGATAPKRSALPAGPLFDFAHTAAVQAHLVNELGADIGAEAPRFQGFLPRVVDAIQARFGNSVAGDVLTKLIGGLQKAVDTIRGLFPTRGMATDANQPGGEGRQLFGDAGTQSQNWVTNIGDIHDTLAKMYAERFAGPAERAAADADNARDQAARDAFTAREVTTPGAAGAPAMNALDELLRPVPAPTLRGWVQTITAGRDARLDAALRPVGAEQLRGWLRTLTGDGATATPAGGPAAAAGGPAAAAEGPAAAAVHARLDAALRPIGAPKLRQWLTTLAEGKNSPETPSFSHARLDTALRPVGKVTLRRWLAQLTAERDAATAASPQGKLLQQTEAAILRPVAGDETALAPAAANRLAQVRAGLVGLLRARGDTPAMATVRDAIEKAPKGEPAEPTGPEKRPVPVTPVARGPRPVTPFVRVPPEPQRLINFLRQKIVTQRGTIHEQVTPGGLRDVGGNVSAIIGGARGRPGLIDNVNGQHLDAATQRAWEAGYFPEHSERPDINALLDKIDEDHRGNPQYSDHDAEDVQAYRDAHAQNDEIDRLGDEHGIPTTGITNAEFFDRLHDRLSENERDEEEAARAASMDSQWDDVTHAPDWPPDENYGMPRTLEDLEHDRRQEADVGTAGDRATGDARPGPVGRDAGEGAEGGPNGGRHPGDAGRGDAGEGEAGKTADLTPPAGAPETVTHTTQKGKVLTGTIRRDLTLEQAKALDPYTFKKDGGYFIRARASATTEPAAEPAHTDTVAADAAAETQRRDAQVAKLREQATRMHTTAEDDENRDRKTNTAKRAREAAGATEDARKRQQIATTMQNLADGIERGEAPRLAGVTSRAAVEQLEHLLRMATLDRQRDEKLSYADQQKQQGAPITEADIARARMPNVYIHQAWAKDAAAAIEQRVTRGHAKIIRWLRDIGSSNGPGYPDEARRDELREALAAVRKKTGALPYDLKRIAESLTERDRITKLGITNDAELQDALREFLQYRGARKQESPIARMERELVGKSPGVDFFPTPKALADRLVLAADVRPGMRVLEPSAGKGDLADAARDAGANVDTVELSSTLRELLEAKGHTVVGNDFDTFEPTEGYDRIIMNPPFSNGLDAAHVQRAYGMLKPGGRLVAITGEGVHSRGDKQATAFREFLDTHDAEIEKLPEGSFKSAFRSTGVATRLVVVDKPLGTGDSAVKFSPRRLPPPPKAGEDLFGRSTAEPKPREEREPTIKNDKRQVDMFGTGDAAVQAQAARDQTGRGGLNPKGAQQPADEGLFKPADKQRPLFSPRAPVAEVRSDEIAAPGTPDRFKAIRQWALQNLRGQKVPSDALGADVTVNRTGIDKSLNRAGDDILSAIPAIPNLIAHGERLGEPVPPRNPAEAVSTKAWHLLGGTVRIDGRDVRMFVQIREDRAGHYFYELGRGEGGTDGHMKAGDPIPEGTNLSRMEPVPDGTVSDSTPEGEAGSDSKNPKGGTLYSPRQGDDDRTPLYSALQRGVDTLKLDRAPPGQWLSTIKNMPGVKAEELKWSGVEDWLKQQPKPVTRADVQDYLRANALDVREVRGSDEGETGEHLDEQGVRYAGYTLPGGEHYHELLITLPPKPSEVKADLTGARREQTDAVAAYKQSLEEHGAGDPRTRAARQRWFDAARRVDELTERAKTEPEPYRTSHWDEPNVLAHTRFDERTAPDGAKTLLVHEVQSDWHQQGRKEGYKGPLPRDAGSIEPTPGHPGEYNVNVQGRTVSVVLGRDHAERMLEGYLSKGSPNAVPDAPFKTTWPALVMKRVIQYAVDHGFDRVAWAPGDVQNDRYDLSKRIGSVVLHDNSSGGIGEARMEGPFEYGYLEARDTSGKRVLTQYIGRPEELADIVGKDVADRLLNVTPVAKRVAGLGVRERALRGLDLKTGGEGMRGFYDKILPAEVNKIAGKFGAKVGTSEIGTGKPDRDSLKPDARAAADHGEAWAQLVEMRRHAEAISQEQGTYGEDSRIKEIDRRMDALHARMVDETLARSENKQPVHSLDITDRMRGAVAQEGLPLFSPRITGADRETEAYTPEQIRAYTNVGRVTDEPGWRARLATATEDLGRRALRYTLDPYIGVKADDPAGYMALRNANTSGGASLMFLTDGTLKFDGSTYAMNDRNGGVENELIRPLQGEQDRFLWWVAAHRAEQLTKEGRENLWGTADIAAIKGTSQGQVPFDYTLPNGNVTHSREAIYADSLRKYDGFTRNILDLDVESGLITREQADVYLRNPFYVPFYRAAEDDGRFVGPRVSPAMVKQYAFKQLKGGAEKLNHDLWQNSIGNWSHQIDAALRNRAAAGVLDTAVSNGAAREVTQQEYDHQMTKAEKESAVWVMKNGERQYYAIDDKMLYTAVTALNFNGFNGPVMRAMGKFKQWLTIGVTSNPLFMLRVSIRDAEQAIATAPMSYNVLGNIKKGFAMGDLPGALQNVARAVAGREMEPHKLSDRAADVIAGGGTMHLGSGVDTGIRKTDLATMLDSPNSIAAFWKRISTIGTAYHQLTALGEDVHRFALYDKLVAEGVPHDAATFAARDLEDFTLRGAGTIVRGLTQMVPFMNAWAQGLYKVGRSAADSDRNIGTAVGMRVASSATRRVVTVLGATTLLTLALDALYQDDEDYKKRTDDDRNSNFWFKFGGAQFRIPMGFEIAALSRIAANGAEAFFDKEMTARRFGNNVLSIFTSNLSMNPTPQIVRPALDLMMNQSSTGGPITPEGMKNLRSDYQYNPNTTLLSRALGSAGGAAARAIGGQQAHFLSPIQLDYLTKGYFGWLGSMITGTADRAAREFSSVPSRPAPDIWSMATGGMVQTQPTGESRYVDLLYQQAAGINDAFDTYHNLLNTGRVGEARDFLAANRQLIAKHGLVSKLSQFEATEEGQARRIENDPNRSPEQKRVALMGINAARNRVAEQSFGGSRTP